MPDQYDHIPHLTLAEIVTLAHLENSMGGISTFAATREAMGLDVGLGNIAFKALHSLASTGRVHREALDRLWFPDETPHTKYQWRLGADGLDVLKRARKTIWEYVAQ